MKRFAALVIPAVAMRAAAGQAPLAFEAASVKLNTSGGWRREICGSGRTNPGTITALGGSMSSLASSLGQFVSRSVSDRTQLTGLFDFELKWTPDTIPLVPPDAPSLNIDPNGPSIFTALQEQLGLKLESTRGPVDIVVIDRVEHPTED